MSFDMMDCCCCDEESAEVPNMQDIAVALPCEVTLRIFSLLSFKELKSASLVSKSWQEWARLDELWFCLATADMPVDFPDCTINQIMEHQETWEKAYRRRFLINSRWDVSDFKTLRFAGHRSAVFCVQLMNKDLLATGGDGNEVRIWDLKKKKCEHTIHSDRTGFLGMHFDEKQQKLLTGSFNGTLKVWDMNIPKLRDMDNVTVKELKQAMVVKGVDYGDCFEKSELYERAVSSGSLQSTSCRISVEAHMGAILGIDTCDNMIATGGHGGVVKLWNLSNGKNTASFECHEGSVNMVTFFDDGSKLATVGHDGIVAVHDVESRKKLLALGGHVGWVWGLHLDRLYEPHMLVSSSVDRTIRVWDMHTKKCVETILDHPAEVPSVYVDWNRHRMISTSFSGKSLVHDTRMWKPIIVFEGFKDRCTRLAYSTEAVFIGSMDGTVRGFNFAYGL